MIHRYQEALQRTLDSLELTEHNRQLADQYLDLSEPEDRELLKDAEIQNFGKLDETVLGGVYYSFLIDSRKGNEALAARFIRFVVRVGGTTARPMLSGRGAPGDFEYAGKFLTPVETAALQADRIAWKESAWGEEEMLGNNLNIIAWQEENPLDNYPFRELWEHFYETEIRTPQLLLATHMFCRCIEERSDYEQNTELYQKVLGCTFSRLDVLLTYQRQVFCVVSNLYKRHMWQQFGGRGRK